MTKEAMKIAVAEALGWRWYRMPPIGSGKSHRCLFHPAIHEYEGQSPQWLVRADGTERICNMEYMEKEGHVPNYPEDLNACHEMRRSLSVDERHEYGEQLRTLTGNSGPRGGHFTPNGFGIFAIADATAVQHCETFLRVKGLWQPYNTAAKKDTE